MATLEEIAKWCQEARKLLSIIDKERGELADNAPVVGKLLALMEKTPASYPDLPALKLRFEKLAARGKLARERVKAKKMKEAEGKKVVREVSQQLLALRYDIEMAMGAQDPTASPEVKKQALDSARHKPVYDDKCQRILDAIEELEAMPGTSAQVTQLNSLLTVAKGFEPDFEEAYKQLEGLSGTLRAGRAAAQTFKDGLGDPTLSQALTESLQAIRDYGALARIGDALGLEALLAEREKALVDLEKALPGGRPAAIQAAVLALKAVKLKAEQAKKKIDDIMVELKKQHTWFGTKAGELKRDAPANVLQLLLPKAAIAANLGGSQRFTEALQKYQDLRVEFETACTLHAKHRSDWLELDARLKPLLEGVTELLDGNLRNEQPALAGVAAPMRMQVVTFMRAQLVPQHEFEKALKLDQDQQVEATLKKVVAALGKIKAGESPDMDFPGEENAIRLAVGAQDAIVNQAMSALNAELIELGKLKGDTAAFDKARDDQQSAWLKSRQTAFDGGKHASDSPEALELRRQALPGVRDTAGEIAVELNRLTREVQNLLLDPLKVTKSQEDKVAAGKLAEFNEQAAATGRDIEYLAGFGLADNDPLALAKPTLAELRVALSDQRRAAAGGTIDLLALTALRKQATDKRSSIETEMRRLAAAAEQTRLLVSGKLATLRKADKGDKARAAYHDKQQDRLDDLMAMVGSSVATVAAEGRRLLAAFKLETEQFEANAGKPGVDSYAKVDVQMKALKTEVEKSDFLAWLPSEQVPLANEFKELLPTKLKGQSPAEALATVAELRQRVDAAIVKAGQLKLKQAELGTALNEARLALESSGAKASAPTVYADLKKRLDAAAKAPSHDIVMTLQTVAATRLLITGAQNPDRRQRMADKLELDAFRAERDKADYEAALDVFKKNTLRKTTAVKEEHAQNLSRVNTALFDLIASQLDEAAKEAKAHNYPMAREKLRLAQATANTFIEQPLKPEAAARASLGNCRRAWQMAVGGFVTSVGKVKVGMTGAFEGDTSVTDENKKKALDALDPLLSLFNASHFARAEAVLTNDASTPAARAEAKEQALAELRHAQRLLDENALLQSARLNPFAPLSTLPLTAALRQMQGALLVS